MKQCKVEDCDRPVINETGRRLESLGTIYCKTHKQQMRRNGFTWSLKCAQQCGRDRQGLSQVCSHCCDQLKRQGLIACKTHGIQPRKHPGSCSICVKAHSDMKYPKEECINKCGQRSRGNSKFCHKCAKELADQKLGLCEVHGIQALSNFGVNGSCLLCRRAKNNNKHAKHRLNIAEPLLVSQDYKCAICLEGIDIDTAKIDHIHGHCKKIKGCDLCRRDLLCNRCNVLLGRYADSAHLIYGMIGKARYYTDELLYSAVKYLDRWSQKMAERDIQPSSGNDLLYYGLEVLSRFIR